MQAEAAEQARLRADASLATQQAERDELARSCKAVCAERDWLLASGASLEWQLAAATLSREEAADAEEGAVGRLGHAVAELAKAGAALHEAREQQLQARQIEATRQSYNCTRTLHCLRP